MLTEHLDCLPQQNKALDQFESFHSDVWDDIRVWLRAIHASIARYNQWYRIDIELCFLSLTHSKWKSECVNENLIYYVWTNVVIFMCIWHWTRQASWARPISVQLGKTSFSHIIVCNCWTTVPKAVNAAQLSGYWWWWAHLKNQLVCHSVVPTDNWVRV